MSNDTRWGKWLARNINFFDLGEDNEISNESEIAEKVTKIIEKFDFFMMTDYILESLILLREKFCWTFDDIIFFSVNERSSKNQSDILSDDLELKIKEWNLADWILYKKANESFHNELKEYGIEKMAVEKTELERRIEAWK